MARAGEPRGIDGDHGVNSAEGAGAAYVFAALPAPSPTPSPTPSPATIANISTRGLVESGDNVMIGGFIIGG